MTELPDFDALKSRHFTASSRCMMWSPGAIVQQWLHNCFIGPCFCKSPHVLEAASRNARHFRKRAQQISSAGGRSGCTFGTSSRLLVRARFLIEHAHIGGRARNALEQVGAPAALTRRSSPSPSFGREPLRARIASWLAAGRQFFRTSRRRRTGGGLARPGHRGRPALSRAAGGLQRLARPGLRARIPVHV
jgi:hypothetical protein